MAIRNDSESTPAHETAKCNELADNARETTVDGLCAKGVLLTWEAPSLLRASASNPVSTQAGQSAVTVMPRLQTSHLSARE